MLSIVEWLFFDETNLEVLVFKCVALDADY